MHAMASTIGQVNLESRMLRIGHILEDDLLSILDRSDLLMVLVTGA